MLDFSECVIVTCGILKLFVPFVCKFFKHYSKLKTKERWSARSLGTVLVELLGLCERFVLAMFFFVLLVFLSVFCTMLSLFSLFSSFSFFLMIFFFFVFFFLFSSSLFSIRLFC